MRNKLHNLRERMDETVLKDVEFGEAAKENVRQAVRSHSHEPWRRRNFFWFKYGLGVAVCFLLLFGGIFYALSQQTPWGVGKQAEWESGAHGGGSSNSNRSDSHALEKEDDKEDSSGQGKTIRTGQPSSDTRLKIIRMFGREKGWKLTNQDVLRTVNGGKKWSKAGPDYSDLQVNKAFFLDADTAWVEVNNGTSLKLYHTTDGGVSWDSWKMEKLGRTVYDFINERHGWMMQTEGAGGGNEMASIFRTTDGKTWERVAFSGVPGDAEKGEFPYIGNKTGLGFKNPQVGWAAGAYRDVTGKAWLYRTEDGGKTWSQMNLLLPLSIQKSWVRTHPPIFFEDGGLLPVFARNDQTGKNQFVLYHMNKEQSSWQDPVSLEVSDFSPTYDFLDAERGWVVGRHTVYRTMDGGEHWDRVKPGGHFQLALKHGEAQELDLVSEEMARLLVDIDGDTIVLKTENGGESWNYVIEKP